MPTTTEIKFQITPRTPLTLDRRLEIVGQAKRALVREVENKKSVSVTVPEICRHCYMRSAAETSIYCSNQGCIDARALHRERIRSLSDYQRFENWTGGLGETWQNIIIVTFAVLVFAAVCAIVGLPPVK